MRTRKFRFVVILFFIFSLLCINTPRKVVLGATESLAECVVEGSSRRLLLRNRDEKKLPMASTTKILTAILIIDDCNLDDKLTIPQAAEGVEGSSVFLRAGEEYTVEELLYGLMLRSGNDCAVALALYHSGSVGVFAQKMNEKAIQIGAIHSHFTNPHGLPDEKHYTTACDLALISAYAMQNPTFEKIVSCSYYAPRRWKNKNKMLERFEGAIGVKTGFTLRAGRCLVTCAERNGMRLVCVVLNSAQMYERTTELLNDCFKKFQLKRLYDCNQPYRGYAAKESFSYPLLESEIEKVTICYNQLDSFPREKGEIAGQMQIFLENNLLFSQFLYIME